MKFLFENFIRRRNIDQIKQFLKGKTSVSGQLALPHIMPKQPPPIEDVRANISGTHQAPYLYHVGSGQGSDFLIRTSRQIKL